jgi:hypothetical protein
LLDSLTAAGFARTTYLDEYYALQPGRVNGAKRLIVVLPGSLRDQLDPDWVAEISPAATLVWRGLPLCEEAEMDACEYVWSG